jgi:magnesium-transporting ATPase (P-type)
MYKDFRNTGPFYRDPDAPPPRPPVERTWQQLWRQALARPNAESYADLLQEWNSDISRSSVWMLQAFFILILGQALARLIFAASALIFSLDDPAFVNEQFSIAFVYLVCSPFLTLFSWAFWYLWLSFLNLIAHHIFRVPKALDDLAFLMAAHQAPGMILATLILVLIPLLGVFLVLPLWAYLWFLGLLSVKVAYKLGWWESLGIHILGFLGLLGLGLSMFFGCFFALLLLGA